MIHIVFDRAAQHIKLFDPNGGLAGSYRGEGDAWGYTPENPYGHDGWCPQGHYVLGPTNRFPQPIASEGWGQIPVSDIGMSLAEQLVDAGKAQWSGLNLIVGGIAARIGRLSYYGRSGIMIHAGGSNAVEPFADYQQLCRTFGCTRMYNVEWKDLAAYLDAHRGGNTVAFTIVGDPARLPN